MTGIYIIVRCVVEFLRWWVLKNKDSKQIVVFFRSIFFAKIFDTLYVLKLCSIFDNLSFIVGHNTMIFPKLVDFWKNLAF